MSLGRRLPRRLWNPSPLLLTRTDFGPFETGIVIDIVLIQRQAWLLRPCNKHPRKFASRAHSAFPTEVFAHLFDRLSTCIVLQSALDFGARGMTMGLLLDRANASTACCETVSVRIMLPIDMKNLQSLSASVRQRHSKSRTQMSPQIQPCIGLTIA